MRYDLQALKNQRPSSNFTLQARLSAEFTNEFKRLFESFGKRLEATAGRWSKMALDADFTLAEVTSAVEKACITCERMPSYAEFTTILRNNSPRETDEDRQWAGVERAAKQLQEVTQEAVNAFVSKKSQEELENLVREWWTGVYGGNPGEYQIPLRVFLPIFFQDYVEGRGDIGQAIEAGKRKR